MTNRLSDLNRYRTFQKDLNIKRLLTRNPTNIKCKNKVILEKLHEHIDYNTEEIKVSRWCEIDLPRYLNVRNYININVKTGIYLYDHVDSDTEMNWFKNFADAYLFVAFDRKLFAQDEMQVVEHPILGHLVVAIRKGAFNTIPYTVENGKPTPYLIQDAVRKIAFDSYNSKIYGNHFDHASEEKIINAATVLDPPTLTNIVCIEAPKGGHGIYTKDTIRYIFSTAYTAYNAMKYETIEKLGENSRCILHTGFWGCGAYGGNHTLMTVIQILAAKCANIDEVVFYKFSDNFNVFVNEAMNIVNEISEYDNVTPDDLFENLHERRFEWKFSDGN